MMGLRKNEGEKFHRFFALIQAEAEKRNSVFFADAGDGNDFETSTMEGENMMGWLVPSHHVEEFEALWNSDNVDDSWSYYYTWAIWTFDNNSSIQIFFDDNAKYPAPKAMKAKYIGTQEAISLTTGALYDVLSIESGWYRIVDDTGEDYLFPPDVFNILPDGEFDRPLPPVTKDPSPTDLEKLRATLVKYLKPYDRVLLTNGNSATIVEIFEKGCLFLADVDRDNDTYTEEISSDDIQAVLQKEDEVR